MSTSFGLMFWYCTFNIIFLSGLLWCHSLKRKDKDCMDFRSCKGLVRDTVQYVFLGCLVESIWVWTDHHDHFL